MEKPFLSRILAIVPLSQHRLLVSILATEAMEGAQCSEQPLCSFWILHLGNGLGTMVWHCLYMLTPSADFFPILNMEATKATSFKGQGNLNLS
jgi:hypothetical protein